MNDESANGNDNDEDADNYSRQEYDNDYNIVDGYWEGSDVGDYGLDDVDSNDVAAGDDNDTGIECYHSLTDADVESRRDWILFIIRSAIYLATNCQPQIPN